MLEKLVEIEKEFENIDSELVLPEVINDRLKYEKLLKRRKQIEKTVILFREYQKVEKEINDAENILKHGGDKELADLAKEELTALRVKFSEIENDLKLQLLPKDPSDMKDCIMEIRGGAGGEEAALFAQELFRMYLRYAENKGYATEILSESEASGGGLKEGIIKISGQSGAYGRLKYESGVHRVQRIPVTESQGRIHTSTATVAVLPVAEEIDIAIKPEEMRIDVYRSSGHGGQSVNTTDSAVRITHLPTDIVVCCQDEKSQLKNKIKAMSILRSRLLAMEKEKQAKERGDARLSQIGTGDRSEKIRTYNFPQDRLTDHRIKVSFGNLPTIMNGEIDDVIDKLVMEDQARQLSQKGI